MFPDPQVRVSENALLLEGQRAPELVIINIHVLTIPTIQITPAMYVCAHFHPSTLISGLHINNLLQEQAVRVIVSTSHYSGVQL